MKFSLMKFCYLCYDYHFCLILPLSHLGNRHTESSITSKKSFYRIEYYMEERQQERWMIQDRAILRMKYSILYLLKLHAMSVELHVKERAKSSA